MTHLDAAAARLVEFQIGEATDAGQPGTVGLCKLLDHAAERLALVDPAATSAYLRGLAHKIGTGDTTPAMLAAAETFHLHMIAAIRAAEGTSA